MAIGSGIGGQLGLVAETTYGTAVTVTRFLPVLGAKLQYKPTFVQGGGLSAGTFIQPTNRFVTPSSQAGGAIESEVQFAKMGLLFQALMGSTAAPVQQAATAAYLQTHTLADPFGKSLTVQQGIPQTDGTVRAHTYAGCRVTSAEFSCGVDEILKSTFEVDAKSYTDGTGLASASYTASNVFHFAQMAFKVGTYASESVVSGVRSVSVKIDRGLATDLFYANGAGLKSQPIVANWADISGTIEADFVSKADFLDRFAAGTSTSAVWEFVDTTAIASTYYPTFRVRLPGIHFEDASPVLEGPDVVRMSIPFKVQYDGTNLPAIEYMSTDTTV